MVEIDDDQEQQVQPPAPAQQEQQQIILRIHRTHKDNVISSLLSKLSLREKLSKNKEIEDQNKVREERSLQHSLDPDAHPDDGSDAASFITLDEDDISDLKDPHVYSRFLNIMPDYLLLQFARDSRREKEEKEKRKLDDQSKSTESADDREAKWRCMDGDKATPHVVGAQRPIEFSDILFVTESHIAIPLPFFLNKNLRHIIDHAATLPTVKSNPLPGEMKGSFILNITELTKRFGAELSLDFAEWSEAAKNCFRFHQSRDRNGSQGTYAKWWSSHFTFFHDQQDKIKYYDTWKILELKLHRDYRTQPTIFDVAFYADRYEAAKSKFDILQKLSQMSSAGPSSRPYQAHQARGGRPSGFSSNRGRGFGFQPPPFQSGSRQPNAQPPCCILCAERGHHVSKHHDDGDKSAKFADGKPAWAKIHNRLLCTPDNKEICLKFNIMGDRYQCAQAHGDSREHVCSFCGSKDHFAFAWVCRTCPQSS